MFKSRNPNWDAYVKERMKKNAFMHFIGLDITMVGEGFIVGELDVKPHHLQQNGFLHGGMTSTLCDIVAGFSAYSLVPDGKRVLTVDLRVNYLRAGKGQKVIAKGKVVKPGKHFHFCESNLFYLTENNEEILFATSTSTMGVIDD